MGQNVGSSTALSNINEMTPCNCKESQLRTTNKDAKQNIFSKGKKTGGTFNISADVIPESIN
jgi:hypothetical protein